MKEILEEGYIRLFRKFIDWEWYDDANTMRLFLHCLLLANSKDKQWRGKLIQRGSFISSQPKLAHSLKLSIMQIRNSLNKLKSTGELTVYSTADYSVITVNNYNSYQPNNRLDNRLTTDNKQSSNRLTTTTNKYIVNSIDNNTHTMEKNVCVTKVKLSKEEKEILKDYAKRSKASNVSAYVHTLITNGGYLEILEEEKKKREREQAKAEKKKQEEKAKQKTPEQIQKEQEETQKAFENARKKIFKNKRGETK